MASERNPGLVADHLFVGITRPAMRWGVTYAALIVTVFVSMETFLLTRNLLTLLIAVPMHGLSVLLCLRDARCFELIGLWLRTRALQLLRTGRTWGAASYGPLCVDLPQRDGHRRAVPALGGLC